MKKLLFCLLFGLVTGLYANTGIQGVYWDMPYTKLLLEKKVIENNMKGYKILQEKDVNTFYCFDEKLNNLKFIVISKSTNKNINKFSKIQKKTVIYFDKILKKESINEYVISQRLYAPEELTPYLFLVDESLKYKNNEKSNFIDYIKKANIKKKIAKGKIQICQSTENTIAFIFENIIENENFIILLPHKGE